MGHILSSGGENVASVPIVLNVEQTKRLYKILLPSAIAIVQRRNAEQSQKEQQKQSAAAYWANVSGMAQ
jgi:hypothetical protein